VYGARSVAMLHCPLLKVELIPILQQTPLHFLVCMHAEFEDEGSLSTPQNAADRSKLSVCVGTIKSQIEEHEKKWRGFAGDSVHVAEQAEKVEKPEKSERIFGSGLSWVDEGPTLFCYIFR
jgi:hypothetical protein